MGCWSRRQRLSPYPEPSISFLRSIECLFCRNQRQARGPPLRPALDITPGHQGDAPAAGGLALRVHAVSSIQTSVATYLPVHLSRLLIHCTGPTEPLPLPPHPRQTKLGSALCSGPSHPGVRCPGSGSRSGPITPRLRKPTRSGPGAWEALPLCSPLPCSGPLADLATQRNCRCVGYGLAVGHSLSC